nr:MAG TPA: virion morphogenesis protein [Caudoviricetes sp.]
MANFDVKVVTDNVSKQLEAIEFIKENSVYIGIQQKDTTRENDDVTNAELLFIHTNGSPQRNIPPRPVIEPALKDDSKRLSDMMKKAAEYVFDGRFSEALRQLELVGHRGQKDARDWFYNPKNHWPPNAPSVIREKLRKGATEPHPLIDTNEMHKAITYFVKIKGGRKNK